MPTNNHSTGIVEIPLTRGYVTVIDECDSDLALFKWNVYARPERTNSNLYAKRVLNRRFTEFLHRRILERIIERKLSANEFVDHIDTDGLNNRRNNLRLATYSENARNRKINANNQSGYKGVIKTVSGRCRAQIRVNGKKISLGMFATAEEAHEAYKSAATKYHGEFARFE